MPQVLFESPFCKYTDDQIISDYTYHSTKVVKIDGRSSQAIKKNGVAPEYTVVPETRKMKFFVDRKVPKVGVMLVGWGGNNGSTFTAVVLANKHKLSWETKRGTMTPNYYGSMVKSSTACLGVIEEEGDGKHSKMLNVPICDMLPFLDPNSIEIDGWDINNTDLVASMKRAEVLDLELQKKVAPYMSEMKPRPSVFHPGFLASNQTERANNLIPGKMQEKLDKIRADIQDFKKEKRLEKVIVMWTASTERFTELESGLHDSAAGLLGAIKDDLVDKVSPSTLFAVASILEGCCFINGSPQNTLYKGVVELAEHHGVHLAGDDFKTGQTKLKSALVDFLISSGLKPVSIVSYNHLGNNDGKNLEAPPQFRSKEISKGSVIDDMVRSNPVLYKQDETPDHCIVIKYVPYVGDSKRALDEYTSEICMHGISTISLHNTCEDSLLAVTVMLDLVLLAEIFHRITVRFDADESEPPKGFDTILSTLGFLLKAPLSRDTEPLVNAFFAQRSCIENILRACLGLPPQNNMWLECKLSGK